MSRKVPVAVRVVAGAVALLVTASFHYSARASQDDAPQPPPILTALAQVLVWQWRGILSSAGVALNTLATAPTGVPVGIPARRPAAVAPVNAVPIASNQLVTTAEDTPAVITLMATDTDSQAPTSRLIISPPTNGTLMGSGTHRIYIPHTNFNGSDRFTFRAGDGPGDSTVATVSITVTPVNDVQVANSQSVTIPEGMTVAITLTGSEADGDPLAYTVVSGPANGTLSGVAPTLTYTPAARGQGSDAFAFTVNDGVMTSPQATVLITVRSVTDAPVAEGDGDRTTQHTPLLVSGPRRPQE